MALVSVLKQDGLGAEADDGSQYEDGSEGEEEHSNHSGSQDEAGVNEVLDEVVNDVAEDESSYEDSLENAEDSQLMRCDIQCNVFIGQQAIADHHI